MEHTPSAPVRTETAFVHGRNESPHRRHAAGLIRRNAKRTARRNDMFLRAVEYPRSDVGRQEFIDSRNSSLLRVPSMRRFKSVIASIGFMSAMYLRSTHMRLSVWAS